MFIEIVHWYSSSMTTLPPLFVFATASHEIVDRIFPLPTESLQKVDHQSFSVSRNKDSDNVVNCNMVHFSTQN